MNLISEFRTFAMRGNVIDMAVGIIIGAAFGKIVSSLVADVIMPPVGLLVGGIDLSAFAITLKEPVTDTAAGEVIRQAVVLKIGNFIQTLIDFTIIAWAIFMMVRAVNTLTRKRDEAPAPAVPPSPTKDQELLTEIRDLLQTMNKR